MAKKKEVELTPEERLQQALVPEEEWTYELPEGWKWYFFNGVVSEVKDREDIFKDVTVKYIGLENIAANYGIMSYQCAAGVKSTKTVFHTGDVLYGKLRPYLNKHDIANFSGVCSTDILVLRPSEFVDARYINYYLETSWFITYAISNSKGINLPRVSPSAIGKACIPLPPIYVQKKITDFLDQEFARLDKTKEQIQSVIDSAEERKQSILFMAVTGKLSKKWRKKEGHSLTEWHTSSVRDSCKDIKVGIVIKPTRYYTDSNGIPAFRSANVQEFHVQNSDWVYINQRGQDENQRTIVHKDDVLIVRSGNPGTACVVPEKCDGYNAIDIIIAVPNQEIINPEYLCIFTNSPKGRMQISSGIRGMALTHFNVGSYGKLEINIPPIDEQKEIISLVKKSLMENDKATKMALRELKAIYALKQSILNKAFCGELIR